jgi:hypothetical protein
MSLIVISRATIARLSSPETGAMLSSFTISGCKVEPERASTARLGLRREHTDRLSAIGA